MVIMAETGPGQSQQQESHMGLSHKNRHPGLEPSSTAFQDVLTRHWIRNERELK